MPGSQLYMADGVAVDELDASMMNDLVYWQSRRDTDGVGSKCTLIFKVPKCIRASHESAYEPHVLSIGPFHRGRPSLLPMEKEKWLCLDYVLKLNCNRSLPDYLAVIKVLESEARICYSEDSLMNSRMFVEMLLLDSCFVLVCLNGIGGTKQQEVHKEYYLDKDVLTEIVVRQNKPSEKGKEIFSESIPTMSNEDFVLPVENDQVEAHQESMEGNNLEPCYSQAQEYIDQCEQWYNSSAVYDLLLLENQIPFFVVTKIYELLVGDESTANKLLTDNLAKFIEGVLLHWPTAIQDTNRPEDFEHLLHLCYIYFKPSRRVLDCHQMKKKASYFQKLLHWSIKYLPRNVDSQENGENRSSACSEDRYSAKQLNRWRRAEEYHEAGVEFKETVLDEHNPHSPLDIEFTNGILYLPCLPIDDKSVTLLRNLLAFEQSCPALGNAMASYIYFMSRLTSVPDDVTLLARKGVIVHQLDSDEEVSIVFSRLFENAVFNFTGDNYLKPICHRMEEHYQNQLNRWMSWLWHNHFGNPWLGFAALASVVMVLCSIRQTIIALLAYMSIS